MPFTFTMPKLSPTMEEGTIVKWHKKEGEFVDAGDVIIEVATDKATVEHTALDEGWLRKILITEGSEASVNQPIAIFTEEEKEEIKGYQPEGEAPVVVEEKKEDAPPPSKEEKPAPSISQPVFVPPPPMKGYKMPAPTRPEQRVFASPLAKKIAEQEGLDLTTVKGSGPGGRITKKDLAKAQPAGIVAFDSHVVPTISPGTYEEEKLTPMRKVIGKRLQEAKSFIPHFYVTQEVNASPMVDLRNQLKQYGVKVSFNDLILRATALALRLQPALNTGYNSQTESIIHYKTIDISVAVSIEGGLITPIIRHADYKSIGQISVEVKDLAKKARDGKLQPEEYIGGSFTVSNLGMYGISEFDAVINPPQAAILAVGGIRDVPVIQGCQVIPGKQIHFTLSSDHRVIDGAAAAEFLGELKRLLESPAGLLV